MTAKSVAARVPSQEADADSIVQTHGLTKHYGAIVAVDNINLTVRKGEIYGFLGPNGAGKTTMLRMLLGLIRPTAGASVVAGAAPGFPESLARIGAIVETAAFYPCMSGYDNLRLRALYCGVLVKRIGAALDQVELTPARPA